MTFLLFLISFSRILWHASGEDLKEDTHPVCMLQMSSQLLHRHRNPLPSSLTNASSTDEDTAWWEKKFILLAHHKSGTGMCMDAAMEMNGVLNRTLGHTDLPTPMVWTPMFANYLDGLSGLDHVLDESSFPTEPSCIAQVVRNPFEMVVTGYLYHMSEAEEWLSVPFGEANAEADGCSPLLVAGQVPTSCEAFRRSSASMLWSLPKGSDPRAAKGWQRSTAQVFLNSLAGPVSDVLPDANANETYPEYLSRVDLDAGLIAEFIHASDSALAPMNFTFKSLESHPCWLHVCYDEFYNDCGAAWQQVFQAWQIPEPQKTTMLYGALKSCPRTSEFATIHSSDYQADEGNVTHPPEREMTLRLRELDRIYLNGTLAALEEHLGCSLSGEFASYNP